MSSSEEGNSSGKVMNRAATFAEVAAGSQSPQSTMESGFVMNWLKDVKLKLSEQQAKEDGCFRPESDTGMLNPEESARVAAWRSRGGAMGYCPPEVRKLLTRPQYKELLQLASDAQYDRNRAVRKVIYIVELTPKTLASYARKGEAHLQKKFVHEAISSLFKMVCPNVRLNIASEIFHYERCTPLQRDRLRQDPFGGCAEVERSSTLGSGHSHP